VATDPHNERRDAAVGVVVVAIGATIAACAAYALRF